MKVTLQPGGREFEASPREPLLDALLRAGVSVRYQCNNGSCGECRAKLLQGELQACRHGDFVLSRQDREQKQFLLCTHAPATDLELMAPETDRAADIPQQTIDARIHKIENLDADIIQLNVRTPRSKTLWFLAGQSVDLELAGLPPLRAALASCPCNGMQLQFHLRRDASSRDFIEALKPKADIRVIGPVGSFVLDEDNIAPLLFVAWDTGFAAAKSILEHLIALEWPAPVRLLRAAAGEHYLENHCRSWAMALDDYAYETLLLPPDRPAPLVEKALQWCSLLHDGRPWRCYLSGPRGVLEPVAEALQAQAAAVYRDY